MGQAMGQLAPPHQELVQMGHVWRYDDVVPRDQGRAITPFRLFVHSLVHSLVHRSIHWVHWSNHWSIGPIMGPIIGLIIGPIIGPLVQSWVHWSHHWSNHWSIGPIIGPTNHTTHIQAAALTRLFHRVSSLMYYVQTKAPLTTNLSERIHNACTGYSMNKQSHHQCLNV